MGWYSKLHEATEKLIVEQLKKRGHSASREVRRHREVIFDVYDATTGTAYEVLTAKIVRSGHEQDEAILAKIFRYLLEARSLKFWIASYNHEELEMFHRMGIEHWHAEYDWFGRPRRKCHHRGKSAARAASDIIRTMQRIAPLAEWCRPRRRAAHMKDVKAEKAIAVATARLGLPKNFLKGIWRDWRLLWVWKLEKLLPQWPAAMQRRWLRTKPHRPAQTPQRLRKRKIVP
ncbi:MAG: hypothetical protein QXF55_00075 [Candidatus Aenigmatarchaeota archaeon]